MPVDLTVYDKRIAKLQEIMNKRGTRLALFGCDAGYQYLTGKDNRWRFRADTVGSGEFILVPSEGASHLFTQQMVDENSMVSVLKGVLSDIGFQGGRVAVGRLKSEAWTALTGVAANAEFVSADEITYPLRLIKDDSELFVLQNAASITDQAVKNALPDIKAGISMRDLNLLVEMEGKKLGAVGTSFDIVCGFIQSGGSPSGSIFSYDLDEGLKPETTIFFDVGFVVDGYCSDWGRSLYFGKTDRNIGKAYQALQTAVVQAVESIQMGTTRVNELYPKIESVVDDLGFGQYLRARLKTKSVGHQIGIEVHELPWLEPQNSEIIKPGMVFCLEPKLWDDGNYYLRVEDMVSISNDGAKFLTHFDRELFDL